MCRQNCSPSSQVSKRRFLTLCGKNKPTAQFFHLERETGIEPATASQTALFIRFAARKGSSSVCLFLLPKNASIFGSPAVWCDFRLARNWKIKRQGDTFRAKHENELSAQIFQIFDRIHHHLIGALRFQTINQNLPFAPIIHNVLVFQNFQLMRDCGLVDLQEL